MVFYKMVQRAKKALKWVDTIKKGYTALAGKDLARAVSARATGAMAEPVSFAVGGKVKKTGLAKVHKGEVVLSVKQKKALMNLLK
jgi:hypothetical protein